MQPNLFFALEQIIERQPLTVTPDTPLAEVVNLMQHRGNSCRVDSSEDTAASNSSCVLIVENNRLLGIFTERDLVKLIATETHLEVAIKSVMTQDVTALTYTGSEDIFIALNLLRSHRIRHLPIVDSDNNLLGLTTVKNLRQKLQPIDMMKWRKVAEIMETRVIHAHPHDSVRHVARLMVEDSISCVAIGETDLETNLVRPLGIITERDIVQFQSLNLDLEQPARNVMSAPLFLVSPDDTLWSVHQQMQQRRIRRLLVGGTQGELAGIVTQTSLLQVFDPAEMYGVIESLQQQVCQLELAQMQLLENRQAELEREVKERTSALRIANQQGRAIAELGQYALATVDLALILQRAVYLVTDTLEVEYCKILKLLPNDTLFLEAGVGWQPGLVGTAILSLEESSQAGYTLQHSQPVVVEDLREETRFNGSQLLIDHGVISGMSIIIVDRGRPYGVLGTHTTQHRLFTQDDVNFIQAIANIIAQANERLQAETELKASEQKFDSILSSLKDIVWSADARTLKLIYVNQAAENIYGRSVAEFYQNENLWLEVVHPEDRDRVSDLPHQTIERGSYELEYRIVRPNGEIRWLLDRANITYDADNRPLRLDGNSTDITQRKQAEALLEESQKRYDLAVRGSSTGLWDWNVLTDEVYYAPRFKEIIGYKNAEMPNTFEAWSSKLHPEDRERVFTAVQNHLENRTPYNVEYRLQKKNRQYCWVQTRGQAIWNEQGEAIRMAGSIADIGDRKRREDILKDIASGMSVDVGENFLPSLVDYLTKILQVDFAFVGKYKPQTKKIQTLAIRDRGQILVDFEYDLAGTPCEQVIKQKLCIYSQNVAQLFPDDLFLEEMGAKSYAGTTILNSNGRAFGIISIIDRQPFNDVVLVKEVLKIFASRLTTELERQQVEAENREQAALLDVATDAIMVRGLDNQLLFWNKGAEKLYGWTQQEALKKDATELLYHTSLNRLSEIQQAVRKNGEWQGELQQITKTGREIIVESRWTLVKDEAGEPKSYLVVNTDITEQQQLEKQFLRTQRLESLGTLAGGIAHDLNNILAPILGFAKLLPLKLPDVDEQTQGFFKIMETNAQRGTALVKQILTFSRGLEGEKGIVQIRHLINEIGQIISETFPKAIELNIDAPKTLWTVNADVNQLHQVLMNLCVNARDAMPDGGKLIIKAENFTVDREYARLHLDAELGSYVKITVTDTGIGIAEEIIDRIFEPFFTTKEIGHGTGLGLSTAIGIVKNYGGFIEVISDRKNKGTEFQVFLPASDTVDEKAIANEEIIRGNGELILIVDDESSILEVTRAILETYNYQVLTAANGIEAVATYAKNKDSIALVIMDIMMPGMDGKTAIHILKQIDSAVKIIAVSGLITNQEIINELDNEVIAFLSKPHTNEELLETVYEIVSR